jgi:hypothetical protein
MVSKVFTKQTETNTILYGAIIGIVCLLTYTFMHTGALLARYVYPPGFGYICAFGVEAIIALTSYRLATLRKQQTKSKTLVFILAGALLVSAFANVYEGHTTRYGYDLTWQNIGEIDPIQAFIGLTATGLISVLVFAVSEIIGNDADAIAKANTREQRKAEQGEQQPVMVRTPHKQGEHDNQTDYKQVVFAYLNRVYTNGNTPNSINEIPVRQTAEIVGCSPATASKHIKRWFKENRK